MISDTTFFSTRVFPCTPEALYAAFERPEQLAQWWGPDGFRNEFSRFEFAPDGAWEFVMIGPDGRRYDNKNRFLALSVESGIVIRHESAPLFTLEVRWQAVAQGTRLNWTQRFDDPAVAAAVRAIVEPANEQNLDRLGQVLLQTAKTR